MMSEATQVHARSTSDPHDDENGWKPMRTGEQQQKDYFAWSAAIF
jgi:hypothetical protein